MTLKRDSRRGRPPAPVERVRSRRIVTYVTDDEFLAIATIADCQSRSLSAVVHEILLSVLNGPDRGATPQG
jgi:hypothetical protein